MRPCRALLFAILASFPIPSATYAAPITVTVDVEAAGKGIAKAFESKSVGTQAMVDKLDGTIMVDHVNDAGQKESLALETLGAVSRGDLVTVYDKSWVLLKTLKGDKIGLLGPAIVAFDELYKGGPDRQVRMLIKSGRVYVQSKPSNSRQSFFEVHTGPLVSTLGRSKCHFNFDPTADRVEIRSLSGNLKTTDANGERKYYLESRRVWEKGQLTQRDPQPLPDNAYLEFKTFFQGDRDLYDRIVAANQAALEGAPPKK